MVRSSDEWAALPDGVQGAVEYLEPPYRNLITGTDWYVWDNGVKRGPGGMPGEWADPPDGVDPSLVKRSCESLPDEEWNDLLAEMMEARQWP